MSNNMSRIFKVIKNVNKNNQNSPSEFVSVTIKTVNPLTVLVDNRLILTDDFIAFDNNIDISKISVDDIFNAFTFNNGQTYFINQVIKSKNVLIKNDNSINSILQRLDNIEKEIENLKS